MKSFHNSEQGSIRIVMLALVSFFLGIGVAAFWFHRPVANNAAASEAPGPAAPREQVGIPAPPPAPAPVVSHPQPIDPAIVQDVKEQVPDYASVSLEDGEQALRAAALREFAAANAATDDQIKTAQQQLQDAQNSGSASEQQAAMKHVQDMQMAGAEKLKGIATKLQDEIAALKSLKSPH